MSSTKKNLSKQKRALCTYGANYDLLPKFTATQSKLVENTITNKISSSTASAADVIPAIGALTCLLQKRVETDSSVKTSKATLLEAIWRKFSDIDSKPLHYSP